MTSFDKIGASTFNNNAYAQMYERLPIQGSQIRVLCLNQTIDFNDPIHCELKVVDLDKQHVRYVGISYTWGTEARDNVIHCGNLDLSVTTSCTDVLRVMRARGETDVWIDQVCIDQANMEERSAQVAFMGNIYAHASIVFVWLGQFSLAGELSKGSLDRDLPNMSTAIQALRTGQKRNLDELNQKDGDRSNVNYEKLLDKVLPKQNKDLDIIEVQQITNELLVFLNLFERPYFERRWVIQEVTGHEDVRVLVGNMELSFDILFDVALHLRSFYSAVMEPWWLDRLTSRMGDRFIERLDPVDLWMRSINVDMMQRIRMSRHANQDLVWHVLHGSTFFRTADPRDSLYSLQAIWTTQELPKPDYSLDVGSVTVKYTQWLIEKGHGALVLTSAPLSRLSCPDVPSWCVDFSCAFDLMVDNTMQQDLSYRLDKLYVYLSETATPGMRSYGGQATYYRPDGQIIEPQNVLPDAAGSMPCSFELHDTDRPELHTKVIFLDTVSDMLPRDTAHDVEKYEAVWNWYRSKASMQTSQVRQRIDSQRWWSEMVGYGSVYEHNVVFREKMFYHLTASSEAGQVRPPTYKGGMFRTPDNFKQDEGFMTFWDYGADQPSYTMLGDIIFGVTCDGWPVLLPPDVQPGDKVAFICGVRTPFVFRSTADSRYQIVGQVHVMSLMWWWNEIPEAIRDKEVQTLILV